MPQRRCLGEVPEPCVKASCAGANGVRLFLVKPLTTVVISTRNKTNISGFLMPQMHHHCVEQWWVGGDPSPGPLNCSELEPSQGSVTYLFFLNPEYVDLSEDLELQR